MAIGADRGVDHDHGLAHSGGMACGASGTHTLHRSPGYSLASYRGRVRRQPPIPQGGCPIAVILHSGGVRRNDPDAKCSPRAIGPNDSNGKCGVYPAGQRHDHPFGFAAHYYS